MRACFPQIMACSLEAISLLIKHIISQFHLGIASKTNRPPTLTQHLCWEIRTRTEYRKAVSFLPAFIYNVHEIQL